ncbi:helix-turn-helix transcriptional regulator [Victivallis vadensis]|uniref:AraC family transcriptional regulator n=1 Tax=Victivallis vadensis TaxID=172901 RepID=A0A2U1AYS4_9BACT|nr:AraC family transcriptional regulator [Victivallis vadensis]PVY41586.1 AraC family transcriptional regulator [Victivallis vadensis]HJH03851.1 AraC family transcriptional regulator [Victivallis vadensis]
MKILHWETLSFRSSSILKLFKHHLPTGGEIEEHRHDFHEIFWILSGEAEHEVNGERSRLRHGDLVWIRPHDRHRVTGASRQPLQFYNLAFPAEIIGELTARYEEFRYYFGSDNRQPIMIPLSESLFEWLDRGAAGLRNNPESRLALDRFLMNLVGELSTMLANPYRRCPAWLQEAAAELERQPEHLKLGSRALAVLAGRTPEHVARELRRFAGVTPSEAVNRARADYAARLLSGSDLTITQIAYQCGFGSLSGFFPAFRRFYGETPLEYRRTHRIFANICFPDANGSRRY